METRKRNSETRRSNSDSRGARVGGRHKAPKDHNETRRELYASDSDYADRQRKAARDAYRKTNPLQPSKLTRGLLSAGTLREVYVGDMEHPQSVETYTVSEAAHALGRSELTFRRWISSDLIPDPILIDTVRGYRHYSAGELKVMARMLAEHEREFSYYTNKHEDTRQQIMQAIEGYRRRSI